MVTNNNQIKILDFGFARNPDDTNYDTELYDIQHKFAIPSETYSKYTEIYCIGAILYTLVSGHTFDDYNEVYLASAKCNERLKEAIKICLQTKPTNRFEDATKLKNYIYETSHTKAKKSFSLDFFKDYLKRGGTLHFCIDKYPSVDDIKIWLEVEYRNLIKCSTFQSTINLITLLMKIPGAKNYTYYKNQNYDISKEPFEELLSFYDELNDDIKTIFVQNIHLIIIEVSKDDDCDLPFC